MFKYRNRNFFSIIIIFIISFIITGCTNKTNHNLDDRTIVKGKVVISGINDSDTGQGQKFNNTSVKNDIYTSPLQTVNFNPDEYIIKFSRTLNRNFIHDNILQKKGKVITKISDNIFKVRLEISNNGDLKLINQIKNNSLVSYIEPEYLVHIQAIPDDPHFYQQWNLTLLGLDHTWDSFRGSKSVTVAVIDTGILPDHPDLQGNIIAGYDFIDNDHNPVDNNSDFSHGTHVAGIIGAMTNNSLGISGINWNVNIMPVRVIGEEGSGGYSALISGIYWAVDNKADIINLSLAGTVDSTSLREAVNYAIDNGVTVIAAAGNNGTTPVLYPARYPEVLSIGAIGPDYKRAYYSNFGPELDLVAPGGDNSAIGNYNTILSTAGYMNNKTPIHQYTWAQGTSMATPHVSGLVALLYSNGIDDPVYIKQLLKDTADDLGISGKDKYYGAGLININRALRLNDGSQEKEALSSKNQTNSTFNFNQVKILVYDNDNKQQSIVTTNNYGQFSLSLSKGNWTITGLIDNNDNNLIDNGEPKVIYNIKIPGTDYLLIEF